MTHFPTFSHLPSPTYPLHVAGGGWGIVTGSASLGVWPHWLTSLFREYGFWNTQCLQQRLCCQFCSLSTYTYYLHHVFTYIVSVDLTGIP